MKNIAVLLALIISIASSTAFLVPASQSWIATCRPTVSSPYLSSLVVRSTKDEEDEASKENPYSDPNYPELEFVDYSDPNYVVDQGVGDELFASTASDSTEAAIEAMREERRRKNDEFQFQTYFSRILKSGKEYKGEWTVYKTVGEIDGIPTLVKAKRPLKVISRAYKSVVDTDDSMEPIDAERIHHEERAIDDDSEETKEIMSKVYWPTSLRALDFRGHQGIQCVGNAYTICTAVSSHVDDHLIGPFSEYRAEIGLNVDQLRMRVKLDYAVDDSDAKKTALRLQRLIVCREAHDVFPSRENAQLSVTNEIAASALFGKAGAEGGLYDPPPVGCDEQASRYMMLDLDGRATVLFPHTMDQDEDAFEGYGWVTSLDWTPFAMRYQVDRKTANGRNILGLRTLELSEVQSADADTYRPRDGGKDMRQ